MLKMEVVASSIALAQIADRIMTLFKSYIEGVSDAPADLRHIMIEVSSLKCVLEVLDLSVKSNQSHGLSSPSPDVDDLSKSLFQKLGGSTGPIEGCHEALKGLESLFSKETEPKENGKRKKLGISSAALAWPFKMTKAQKWLGEIGSHKSNYFFGAQY